MNAVVKNLSTVSTFDEWIEKANRSIVTFKEDPFALSAASYRYWREGLGRFRDFDTLEVTDQDRTEGNAMRLYYRGRLVFGQLKNTSRQPVSEFRQKLWALCEGTGEITQNDIGLLYRLPYFYAEDQAHDRIFMDLPHYSMVHQTIADREETFTLQESVLISRRSREVTQYWLRGQNTPVPCMIAVAQDNPLRPLLENLLARDSVRFRANWHPQYMRGYHRGRSYWQLANPVWL